MAEHEVAVSKSYVRRTSMGLVLLAWAYGAGTGVYFGQSVLRASVVAVVPAVGGYAAWFVYHKISRKNNGLFLVLTPAIAVTSLIRPGLSLGGDLETRTIAVAVGVAFVYLLALIDRRVRGRREGAVERE